MERSSTNRLGRRGQMGILCRGRLVHYLVLGMEA